MDSDAAQRVMGFQRKATDQLAGLVALALVDRLGFVHLGEFTKVVASQTLLCGDRRAAFEPDRDTARVDASRSCEG